MKRLSSQMRNTESNATFQTNPFLSGCDCKNTKCFQTNKIINDNTFTFAVIRVKKTTCYTTNKIYWKGRKRRAVSTPN